MMLNRDGAIYAPALASFLLPDHRIAIFAQLTPITNHKRGTLLNVFVPVSIGTSRWRIRCGKAVWRPEYREPIGEMAPTLIPLM